MAPEIGANFKGMAEQVPTSKPVESGSSERAVWRYGSQPDGRGGSPELRQNTAGAKPAASFSNTDRLAIEEPLEIRLGWNGPEGFLEQSVSITMRTPGNDAELAIGFLVSEGILTDPSQLDSAVSDNSGLSITDRSNTIRIMLHAGQSPDLERLRRNFYTTSSCGVCGKASLDAVRMTLRPKSVSPGPMLLPEQIINLPERMFNAQGTFRETGGLHAAGLFYDGEELIILREDVGRHNAVDKVIGH